MHDLLSADLDILHKLFQLFMPYIVELDQVLIRLPVPPEGEPSQAKKHVRDWIVREKIFGLFCPHHRPNRVTILVDPEATIRAQRQLDVGETIAVGEAYVNFSAKRNSQRTVRIEKVTYILSAGVPGSLTKFSVSVL